MTRSRSSGPTALVLALATMAVASPVAAQVVVQSSTTTTAEVTVTGRVTTTTTDTILVPEPVVVAPVIVTGQEEGPSLVPLLTLRGELTLSGAHDMVLTGATALFGLDVGQGWGGGLVAGYFGEIGTSAPSELHLALEAWRDFGPDDTVGFVLLARVGTALVLAPGGPSPRPLGQLGIGARVSLDARISILLDARGELQLRPAGASEGAASGPELFGGLVTTMGLAIHLD